MAFAWPQVGYGSQGFSWWMVIALLAGCAMMVHAWLLGRRAAGAAEAAAGSAKPEARSQKMEETLVFGVPLAVGSWAAGGVVVLVTLVMMLLGAEASTPSLAWTLGSVLVAVWIFYQRTYQFLTPRRRASLLALRVAGMLALVLLLFQPVLGFTHEPASKNTLAVVIDASGSMSVNDKANEPNRYRQSVVAVRNVLAPRLAGLYTITYFAYDGKHTEPLGDADEYDAIPPNGNVTDLATAVRLGSSAGSGQIVLFSDGIHNAPTAVATELTDFNLPVHTVRVGSDSIEPATVPDIAVAGIDGPPTVSVNNQVTLTASIKSTAMSDRTIRVILSKVADPQHPSPGGGDVLDEQRLVLRSGPTPQSVQLKFTPDTVGRMTVRVSVPVDPGERSDANNQQDFPILVTDTKLPVLYVEGRVRPEVGKLMRALATDPNIAAVSLIQVAQGRFTASGVKAGDPLEQGLPKTLAQWKRFRVIILGDLDSSYMNSQQQRDLQQTVKDGAGLLMIGGEHSFAPGQWDKTTLAEMLPVDLSPVQPAQLNTPFVPRLTPGGAAHPILRNITDFFIGADGSAAKKELPMLQGCVALAGPKAGAEVLFVHPSEKVNKAPAVVLAVQQYGKGRTAAFAADTTSQWNVFLSAQGKDSPYNRFWGQMVRWLASQEDLKKKSGPSVTALIPKERYEAGEPVILRAAVTGMDGQSTAFATTTANITSPDGKSQRITLSAIADQEGMYEGRYQPRTAGTFKVVFGASKDNNNLGTDVSGFSILQTVGEMDKLAASPRQMQEIARLTGGQYADISGVASLADRLAEIGAPKVASRTESWRMYHFRWFFLFFVAAMTGEWFLRRRWQLQ